MKRVLVAVLNWGLGHASRSIPIVTTLVEMGHEVIIASDGAAGELLKQEFPVLPYLELPSYDIQQPVRASYLHWLLQFFKMRKARDEERKVVREIMRTYDIQYIISDNRYGAYHEETPSFIITHQLRLATPWPTNIIPNQIIKRWVGKFNACWIPDYKPPDAIAHGLHADLTLGTPIEYMGLLSRLYQKKEPSIYDFAVIISGPEPGRTFFEKSLRKALTDIPLRQAWVLGRPMDNVERTDRSSRYGYQSAEGINNIFNQTTIIIARAGYSTIMDCLKLKKKAIFVVTSGQPEQRYLGESLRKYACFRIISESQISTIPTLVKDLIKSTVHFPDVPNTDLLSFLRGRLG